LAALTTAALHAGGAGLAAQDLVQPDTTVPGGSVVGSVVAAQSGAPLDGAVVLLEPAPGGALSSAARGPSFWGAGRVARTDASGAYRFDGLAVGRYQLHVRRLGYRPASLEIDLGGQSPFRVSVGLVVVPIALEPVDVPGASPPPIAALRADADAAERARLMAEEDRRNRFLASDARSLTGADLTEAVTLGETDLFRALQRLPSVATRDDFTAELWTRGARWTDTRVTFDGMPLFSPVHAFGVVTAVDPVAVGSAFFHPGVRPAASGEGAAATLDLASRPATESGLHGSAELSMISARAALEHGTNGTSPGWMLAARRSYVDLIADLLAGLKQDSTITVPYAFTDLAARVDIPLGATRALEVSGLRTEDALRGTVPNLLRRNQGRWGDAALQATLTTPLAGLVGRLSAGVSRFDVRVDVADSIVPLGPNDRPALPFHHFDRTGISYVTFAGALAPAAGDAWAAGYQVVSQHLHYTGNEPTNYPDSTPIGSFRQYTGSTTLLALWGERRSKLSRRLTTLAGVRVEFGTQVADGPAARIAPRLQARYLVGDGALTLSAGYGRSFQYTQAVGPTGPGVGPELHLSEVWVMAGDTVPAVRSGIATLGAEYWLGGDWIAGMTVYRRQASGIAEPDPTPGFFFQGPRPLFVPGINVARGLEGSLRKLTGRWTASVSLALSRSEMTVGSYHYASSNDRRGVLHATVLLRASGALRVGAALTAASGAAFTRFLGSAEPCDSTSCADSVPYVEPPGGGRTPGYATLDLLADWTRAYRSWSLAAYVQLRNALDATNAVIYTGSVDRCRTPEPPTKVLVPPGLCDYYTRGLPLLPLAGVRVSF